MNDVLTLMGTVDWIRSTEAYPAPGTDGWPRDVLVAYHPNGKAEIGWCNGSDWFVARVKSPMPPPIYWAELPIPPRTN